MDGGSRTPFSKLFLGNSFLILLVNDGTPVTVFYSSILLLRLVKQYCVSYRFVVEFELLLLIGVTLFC